MSKSSSASLKNKENETLPDFLTFLIKYVDIAQYNTVELLKKGVFMKNNSTVSLFLPILLTSFLTNTGPSVRQKSKADAPASETSVQEEIPKTRIKKTSPLTVPTKKNAQPENNTGATIEKTRPKQEASPQGNQELYEIFDKKLYCSSHLTKGIIQYAFDNIFDALEQDKNKPDKKNLQKIKGYFYGLRYPIYRHLREVISACSDPNAFLCGGIIQYIAKSSYDIKGKSLLLTDLKNLGSTLKKFKFYQIDNQLENELQKHLDEVEVMINKKSINQGEKAIIKSHYIAPLTLLKKYIAIPEIKAILPNRESSLYYGYRKTAKTIVSAGTSLGHWLKQRALNHLAMKLFNTYNNYVLDSLKIKQTSVGQKAETLVATGLDKTAEGIGVVLTNPKILINTPLKVIATPFRGINALWKKPKLILEGLQYTRKNFISGTISAVKKLGSATYSGFLWSLFTGYELTMNNYFGVHGLNRWLTGALNAAQRTVSPNVYAATPTPIELQIENINFMTMSATFIDLYTQQLCNAIAQSAVNLPQSTAALQSAQIEIFRHRRTIISELSNKHAFTLHFLYYSHYAFAKDFTDQIYRSIETSIKGKETLTITDDEVAKKADTIIESRINKSNEYFNFTRELTQNDYDVLDKLSGRVSTDPRNGDDIMYLATPISDRMLENMMILFDTHLKKIVDELKSFGTRSRTQLIQNYWLSVIDRSYGKKLQNHLEALAADLDALMADANHTINPLDINTNIYHYTDTNVDGNPIAIAIPAPKVPQSSAQELEFILRSFYINPLTQIAKKLQEEDILKKLPDDKSWYLKYPLYTTKVGLKLGKKAFTTVIDNLTIENIINIGTALSSGGLSAVPSAVLSSTSFSATALSMLDIDFINPQSAGSYLSSGATNAVADLIMNKGPKGFKQYMQGKSITGIVSDIATKSGPVKTAKEALREHQRTIRSY